MAEQTESNWTESRFRQRLVGASVVVALAVLLLPLWLDGSGIDSLRVQSVPEKPEVEGSEEVDIPQPPGDSGEPLEEPPQSLFPDQTPIEARSGDDGEAMSEPMRKETVAPAREKTVEPSTAEASTGDTGDSSDESEPSSDTSPTAQSSEDNKAEAKTSDTSDTQPEDKVSEGADESAEAKPDAAASLPESATDGEFVVQLGSFSDERNARALAESVESSGFDVFVTPLFSEQGTVWRVRVGPYATREQAGEATERLRQRIGRDGLVMTK